MQQEVVEAEGHLIDSHLMEQIFDTVVEYNGRFEVEKFEIGRTNADNSHLRLKIETESAADMEQLLSQLLDLGCTPADSGSAELVAVETRLLRARRFLFHHESQNAGPLQRRLAGS